MLTSHHWPIMFQVWARIFWFILVVTKNELNQQPLQKSVGNLDYTLSSLPSYLVLNTNTFWKWLSLLRQSVLANPSVITQHSLDLQFQTPRRVQRWSCWVPNYVTRIFAKLDPRYWETSIGNMVERFQLMLILNSWTLFTLRDLWTKCTIICLIEMDSAKEMSD